MKNRIIISLFAIAMILIQACGGSSNSSTEKKGDSTLTKTNDVKTAESDNDDFKLTNKEDFLNYVVAGDGTPKTFQSKANNYLFFRKDGTTAGGGNGGEGSMWEGTWVFEGKNLVIKINKGFEDNGKLFAGSHKIGYFPDDNALIIDGVDYILN